MLLELWCRLKNTALAWRSPEALYFDVKDNAPYIPFEDWERLVDQGAISANAPRYAGEINDFDGTF